MSQYHKLKIWPQYFQPVVDGYKTFEVRKNDRNFRQNDKVMLEEYDPQKQQYTGAFAEFEIGYVLPINNDYVVFSLLEIED